ncbi:MAG: hypothetical protein HUK24_00630 [Sphaerochaetaceae bacterium]|nr:hypothetical protein [Sphaerochaetaceae bacterium]
MNKSEIFGFIGTIVVCLFGSGGVVLWLLNRFDATKTLQSKLESLQTGLILALENDRVIFNALRTHEINGESEDQQKKMDSYFLSLLEGGKK